MSFSLSISDVTALKRPLLRATHQVRKPSMGLLFYSGTQNRKRIGEEVRNHWPGIPVILAQGAGVLTEQVDHEGEQAIAGLLSSGLEAIPVWSDAEGVRAVETLGQRIEQAGGRGTLLLFLAHHPETDRLPNQLARRFPELTILGSVGTEEVQGLLDPQGELHEGIAVGLLLRRSCPQVALATGGRRLSEWMTITEMSDQWILQVNGTPVLEALQEASRRLEVQSQIVMVLFSHEDPRGLQQEGLVRPLRLDPDRRALFLSREVQKGAQVAFAVLDGEAARRNLTVVLRAQAQKIAGAAGHFGIYTSSSERGIHLYGISSVDSRILRAQFPGLPIVGIKGVFEISPTLPSSLVHSHSGVFSLFTVPS